MIYLRRACPLASLVAPAVQGVDGSLAAYSVRCPIHCPVFMVAPAKHPRSIRFAIEPHGGRCLEFEAASVEWIRFDHGRRSWTRGCPGGLYASPQGNWYFHWSARCQGSKCLSGSGAGTFLHAPPMLLSHWQPKPAATPARRVSSLPCNMLSGVQF